MDEACAGETADYRWTVKARMRDVIVGQLRNPHPGEILKQEFLNEIRMSQNQLAHAITMRQMTYPGA
jgi:hypothetical protein